MVKAFPMKKLKPGSQNGLQNNLVTRCFDKTGLDLDFLLMIKNIKRT
jgi:hypothetical protein